MPSDIEIVTDFVNVMKTDVVNSLQANDRVASGGTIKALEVITEGNKVNLVAPEYIDALEYGRGPTSPDATAGDPRLRERIEDWVKDRGINEKAVFAITKKIHLRGYPGKPGVLTEPLSNDNIEIRLNVPCEKIADNKVQEILEMLDGL